MMMCSNAGPVGCMLSAYRLCCALRAFHEYETLSCKHCAGYISDISMSLNIADSWGNFYCKCQICGEKSANVLLHCKFLKENEVLRKDLCVVHIAAGQNNAPKPRKTLSGTQNLVVHHCDNTCTNTKFFLTCVYINTLHNSVLVVSITSFHTHSLSYK